MSDVKVMIDDYKFNFRVSCVIENRGRYLLTKGIRSDFYNLPGGRVHAGESTQEAIKRELKEELNLEVENVKLLKVSEQFFEFENKKYHELGFVYYLYLEDENLCNKKELFNLDLPDEKMYWIDKDKLHNYHILPEYIYEIKNEDKISHFCLNKLKG